MSGSAACLLAGTLTPLLSSALSARAASVTTLRAKAAAIAEQIDTLQTKLQILSEEYDQAGNRESALQHQVSADAVALQRTERAVLRDSAVLRKQAIEAYVSGGSAAGLSSMLSSSADALPLQQTYLQAASSNLDEAVSRVKDSEHRLGVRRSTLTDAEQKAAATTRALGSEKHQAEVLEQQLVSAESNVKGQLAAAVAAEEARQRAAAEAAAEAAAKAAAAQPPPPAPTPVVAVAPATAPRHAAHHGTAKDLGAPIQAGDSAGLVAVRAAESQIGVPYVWAGATPGAGFDCSGLTMWAWGQAGVDLPHSAQEQYDSIEHISASELQPGDLIFYASGGYIYHVIMYIGNGEAVQAEDTGTLIQITPVWPGAYGYGRP